MSETTELRLTREDFAARVRVFNRRSQAFLLLFFAGMIPVFWGISVLVDIMERHGIPRESLWNIPVFFLVLVYMLGAAGLADWFVQRTKLKCANCQTPLLRHSNLILVTGRCPECAQPVFANREAAVESRTESLVSGLVSQADIVDAGSTAHRKAIRPALTWAISGAVLIGVAAAANALMQPVVATVLGKVWAPFLWPVLLAPGLVGLFWACIIYERRASQSGQTCPRCGEQLTGYAAQTGNCSTCGQRAVSDPFPGMELTAEGAASPVTGWTVAEFRAISSGREGRLAKGFLIPLGLGMVVCILSRLFENSPLVSIFSWVALPLAGISLWWLFRGVSRDLRCPACERELWAMCGLVISSRRCYHCGSVVLRDGAPALERT